MTINNIIICSNHYLTFIKDQLETLSPQFSSITTLANYHSYYSLFPSKKLDRSNLPANMKIFQNSTFYMPHQYEYTKIGNKHFEFADKLIDQYNLTFDLVHSHFTWPSGYVGAKISKKYNVPFVITAHGYDIYDLPFRSETAKENIKYVLNSANHVITVSEKNKYFIDKLDVSSSTEVIPNGFREDKFYPKNIFECRYLLSLPYYSKIILSVGNLVEIKGHTHLIKAMGEVVKRRKDVLCIILGSGPLKNKLQKQINISKLQNFVQLVGGKPHNEVPLWMNACDIFVLPSLNEGNPTVMFECLGCGKPFIGTKVGGIPEIITSQDYGLLTEPNNSKELARLIEVALDTEWNSQKILQYGHKFTWENIARRIVNIYNQL